MAGRARKRMTKGLAREPVARPILLAEERRLWFAHRNRQAGDSAAGAGFLVQAEFARRCSDGPAWQRRLLAVLEEHAGPELLAKVVGLELRRGVLRLEVVEPVVRSALGFQWQQRVLAIAQAHLPSAGVSAVRFVSGR